MLLWSIGTYLSDIKVHKEELIQEQRRDSMVMASRIRYLHDYKDYVNHGLCRWFSLFIMGLLGSLHRR